MHINMPFDHIAVVHQNLSFKLAAIALTSEKYMVFGNVVLIIINHARSVINFNIKDQFNTSAQMK